VKNMPLSDTAWALIVAATGGVQGKSLWMSRRTWAEILRERPRNRPGFLYSVPVAVDDSMTFGVIRLERRGPR
jgi:hypothetical protein